MTPTEPHQAIAHLFRENPSLLANLGILPGAENERLSVSDADLSEMVPLERRADLVLLVGEPTRLAIALEIQLGTDSDKHFSWQYYAAALANRHRCPGAVLVVTPYPEVATWAARQTPFGLDCGSFQPHVIGPSQIPIVTEPEQAQAVPALAILSGFVHGNSEKGQAVLDALLFALDTLPFDDADIYYDVVCKTLSLARQLETEAAMSEPQREEHPFLMKRNSRSFQDGLQEGRGSVVRMVLRHVARQIGMPGPELQARIQNLPLERLEALDDAMSGFSGMADVEAWLNAT